MSQKIKSFFTPLKIIILLITVVAVFLFAMYTQKRADDIQTHTVSKMDIVQSVQFTGTIEGATQADLSFNRNGKVNKIYVSQGDFVKMGDKIAELDQASVYAELDQAKAAVVTAESDVLAAKAQVEKARAELLTVDAQNRGTDASLEAALINLNKVKEEQNSAIFSAYQKMLNNDLQAYPVNTIRSYEKPVISGTYSSTKEGVYNLHFYHSNSRTGFSLNYDGLESGTVSFEDFGIEKPLGTKGLFISLPESGSDMNYAATEWIVPIPNDRSSSYHTVKNTYDQTVETAKRLVAAAQATYDTLAAKEHDTNTTSLTTAQRQSALAAKAEAEAKLEQAQGKLLQAKTKLSEIKVKVEDGILRAPFDGKIAKLDISYGDQVLTSETPVTVMGDNIMEMDVYIPELDVAKVKVKDTANITIDAFNDDTVLLGTISQIDSVSSEIDGVPAYKATIILTDSDKRIRSGMSAHATVETNKKENVLGIPAQYIMRKNNETNVLLKIGNRKTKLQSVETGMRGTNNFVEVTNGLSENDVIVLPKK